MYGQHLNNINWRFFIHKSKFFGRSTKIRNPVTFPLYSPQQCLDGYKTLRDTSDTESPFINQETENSHSRRHVVTPRAWANLIFDSVPQCDLCDLGVSTTMRMCIHDFLWLLIKWDEGGPFVDLGSNLAQKEHKIVNRRNRDINFKILGGKFPWALWWESLFMALPFFFEIHKNKQKFVVIG